MGCKLNYAFLFLLFLQFHLYYCFLVLQIFISKVNLKLSSRTQNEIEDKAWPSNYRSMKFINNHCNLMLSPSYTQICLLLLLHCKKHNIFSGPSPPLYRKTKSDLGHTIVCVCFFFFLSHNSVKFLCLFVVVLLLYYIVVC